MHPELVLAREVERVSEATDQTLKASGRTIRVSPMPIWRTGFSRLRWPVSPSVRQPVRPVLSGGCCSFSVSSVQRRGLWNRKEEAQLHRSGIEWWVLRVAAATLAWRG